MERNHRLLTQTYSTKHNCTVWVFRNGVDHHLAVVLSADEARVALADHRITAERVKNGTIEGELEDTES